MSSSVKCVDIATEKKEMSKYDKDPQRKENGNRGGGGSVHKKNGENLRFGRDRTRRQQINSWCDIVGDMEIEISCNKIRSCAKKS